MVEKLVHWLSKEARYRIIEVLMSTRSERELAKDLGVTSTAIYKYLERKTHPSDTIIARALKVLNEYEKERVYKLVADDIISAIEELLNNIPQDFPQLREYVLNRLEYMLEKFKEK
ncbi:MAG: helix-turn-helix domain-containing protein [Desulfurococcaceae archaeon]